MKPIQYSLGITPDQVRLMHAWFCEKTGVRRMLDKRIERCWCELVAFVESNRGLFDNLSTPALISMVVKYLCGEVKTGRRFDRSFLLTEKMFFNHERFADDLGLAWKKYHARARKPATVTRAGIDAGNGVKTLVETRDEKDAEQIRERAIAALAECKRKLKA